MRTLEPSNARAHPKALVMVMLKPAVTLNLDFKSSMSEESQIPKSVSYQRKDGGLRPLGRTVFHVAYVCRQIILLSD